MIEIEATSTSPTRVGAPPSIAIPERRRAPRGPSSRARRLKSLGQLAAAVAICQSAGVLGVLTHPAGLSRWYRRLRKPRFTPPASVFPVVWPALYTLMGISAFLVWRRGLRRPKVAVGLATFAVQLILNAAWTPVFFGRRSIRGGMAIMAGLLAAILATMRSFSRVSLPAALLLVPYLLWVTFAAAVNAAILVLNR